MKRACRLAIVLSTLLYAPAFATAAPGDGISGVCEGTSVESNDIADASDVGIAVFGAAMTADDPCTSPTQPFGIGIAVGYHGVKQPAAHLRPDAPRSTIATSHAYHGHSAGEPVRPGYMPDGTPIYLLKQASAGHVPIYLHGNTAISVHVLTRSAVSPPGYQLHGLVGYVPGE